MDSKDRALLEFMQTHFPLVPFPYQALGESVGLPEREVIERVRRLKQGGIVRQVGAIFDSSRLGYRSALVALEVDPTDLDRVGRCLNAHPGISHNYVRDHRYNLWFTLTLPWKQDLEGEAARLAEQVGARDFLYLPARTVFKIGLVLKLGETGEETAAALPLAEAYAPRAEARAFSEQEVRAVRALQRDLPLQSRAFLPLARTAGMEEDDLLKLARAFLAEGIMRRYAATLDHRRAGFRYNFLVLWPAEEGRLEEMGKKLAALEEVSHCYERTSYPRWPFSLYAMFHARSRKEADRILLSLAAISGKRDYLVLETVREFKKERVRYFEEGENGTEVG
jgi:DNA-binding Lrp family transcriptional regulator